MRSVAEAILGESGFEADEARSVITAAEEARSFLPGDDEASFLLRVACAAGARPGALARCGRALLEAAAARRDALDAVGGAILDHLEVVVGVGAGALDRRHRLRVLLACLDALEAADTEAARRYRGRVLDTLGNLLARDGQLADARVWFERALAAKEAAGDAEGLALTWGSLGRLCLEAGAFDAAIDYLERDLAWVRARQSESVGLIAQLETQVGASLLEKGALGAARSRLTRVLEDARAREAGPAVAFAAVFLGRALVRLGDLEEATARLVEVEAFLEGREPEAWREVVGLAACLRAEIAAAHGATEVALAAFAAAREAFEAHGRVSPVERAGVLEGEARALEAAGRLPEAAKRLRQALRLLDGTSAEAARARIDAGLAALDENAWLLHASGRYLGHAQIAFLLDEGGQDGFRGREAAVSVLFSDLVGFTRLSEGLAPDALVALLNRYLAGMTRAIERQGGFVDKFIGDAIMAIFSLPAIREDDADRALEAAAGMLVELERLNRARAPGVPRLGSGIGLHHGDVVAGLIGSPQKRSYTVIGDAVNTASRVEGMTRLLGAPVLVTGDLVARLRRPEAWILVPLGRYRPKGRSGAVEVFHLAGDDDGSPAATQGRARAAEARAALGRLAARDFAGAAADLGRLAARAGPACGGPGYARLAAAAVGWARAAPDDDWDGAVVLEEK